MPYGIYALVLHGMYRLSLDLPFSLLEDAFCIAGYDFYCVCYFYCVQHAGSLLLGLPL